MLPTNGTDLAAGDLAPGVDPLGERADRRQRVGRLLVVPAAAREVVDDEDLVAARGEPHRGRPAEVAVTAEDEDPHARRRVPDAGPTARWDGTSILRDGLRSAQRRAGVRARCPSGTAAASCSALLLRRGRARLRAAPRRGAQPGRDPGADSIVAYQGNDSLAYGQIADGRSTGPATTAPRDAHPTDWSPGAPLFYARRLLPHRRRAPERPRVPSWRCSGALMVLLVYLLGRRLGGPVVGPGRGRAGRDLPDLHRQQRAVPERADRRFHAVGGGARLPVGVGRGPRAVGVARARRSCSARPRSRAPSTCCSSRSSRCSRCCVQARQRARRADRASPPRRCSWPPSRRAGAVDGPQLRRARPLRAGHDRRRQGAVRRHLPAGRRPPAARSSAS